MIIVKQSSDQGPDMDVHFVAVLSAEVLALITRWAAGILAA
jgi:hypothetical protein